MGEATKKPFSIPLIAGAALIGLAGFVYVVLAPPSKPAGADLARFAQGAMAKLVVQAAPPVQPTGKFTDAEGKPRDLAAWRGKVVAVNFWATWCAPCVKEMPTLAKLEREMGGADFAVVPINFDRESDHDYAKRQIAELGGGVLPFYADPSFAVAFDTGAAGFPTTIIYSRAGKEVARLSGDADWSSAEAKALIAAAVAQ